MSLNKVDVSDDTPEHIVLTGSPEDKKNYGIVRVREAWRTEGDKKMGCVLTARPYDRSGTFTMDRAGLSDSSHRSRTRRDSARRPLEFTGIVEENIFNELFIDD